ncbi:MULTISPECIES: HlyD family secretion protein [Bradyrhizobium]|uniref:HlyD family secretion protein n=1 Tax=Bradyrhizobium TaxID=374 RepID=UPI000487E373|nr:MULTISPECIES: HlyD family secretion protein [Bradyrhizobium]MCS3445045.1 membrane fusion protein (multidrug efflux system) [Bradyrhizobium elkanii]MCS3563824.1 membrane fusion protein (multidrug efflux system) [Bradyrhizobium elkanii]MCW2146341.1 membrane fusion protein (multidrug efflux system) [Bradyrhizobium elkanii]MCW2354586.1 membrane fusion protein (multidrug efflux system) [Bradyrhizobium elkanii]MCW2379171.1 membrane fusion protein (multidrug efflux system) [Bradyrhizobium elkanii]
MAEQVQDGPSPASQTAPAKPRSVASGFWGRFAIPLFAVLIALVFVAVATSRWDAWVGSATIQTTNDAYVRAELTQLSSRVSGEVLTVAVSDFQRVKAGDLLVQIDPADYQAQVAQAEAGVVGAQAVLDNLNNQVELQYATIAQAEAARLSAEAQQTLARQEEERQQSLSQTDAGTRQRLEQATASYAKAEADVRASRAVIAAQRHQLEVLQGTKKQRAADLDAAKALLASAKLKLGYTKIVAPFDGVTGERQVQPGDYVNVGANLINVVPLPNVYVIANYKETQLTNVKPGQPVEVTVDTFAGQKLRGVVERIAPASGSQFALLPPDNATGNFTKVVQRIPVRIQFDKGQPLLERLLPGMSVVTRIDTGEAVANGGK